MRFNSWKIT